MRRLLFCLGLLGSAILVFGQYEPVILFEAVGDTANQQLGLHTLVPVGDLDGDGYDDILADARTNPGDSYSWEWRIYYGSANGVDRHVSFAHIDSLPHTAVFSYDGFFDDMDGDGHLDIFASFYQNYTPPLGFVLFIMVGRISTRFQIGYRRGSNTKRGRWLGTMMGMGTRTM